MENPTASPLSWPQWRPRTPDHKRARSRFSIDKNHSPTVHHTRFQLQHELKLLGVRDYILSTNLALRLDGEPRSGQAEPNDPGVAVYFKLNGRDTVLACDCWHRVADNIRAIVKHIDALRGMERWGVGTVEQAFAGFAALPPPIAGQAPKPWRKVMNFGEGECVSESALSMRYRELAKARSGDEAALLELNIARDTARGELSDG